MVLRAPVGRLRSLTLRPPKESWARALQPLGHRMLPGRPTIAIIQGQLCAGHDRGDPRSLTAQRHRWHCLAGWVPHSHMGQLEGGSRAERLGTYPGWLSGCGTTAPLVLGALKAHCWPPLSPGPGWGPLCTISYPPSPLLDNRKHSSKGPRAQHTRKSTLHHGDGTPSHHAIHRMLPYPGNANYAPPPPLVAAPCPTLLFINTPPCRAMVGAVSVKFWDFGVALAST